MADSRLPDRASSRPNLGAADLRTALLLIMAFETPQFSGIPDAAGNAHCGTPGHSTT